MATRSAIGWVRSDGLVRAVYCHWDGEPSHQLPILKEHYNTAAKACSLVAKGSMSELRTENTWENGVKRDPQPLYHTKEDSRPAQTFSSTLEALEHFEGMDCEHLYLYRPGKGWEHTEIQ